MNTLATFIGIALCFLCKTSLAAKECYKCSSMTDRNCSDPPPGNTFEKCVTTTNEAINCLQYTYVLNNREFTYRGCRQQIDDCSDVTEALKVENRQVVNCCLCSTDLCNAVNCKSAGSSVKPIFIVTSLILLLKFFLV